jgi:menaquinone-dependent protoporphyrinogen oxidase
MSDTVLVTYASKHGATEDIAGKIGQVLSLQNLSVSVMPAGDADIVDTYDAFVIGSASYVGQWRKEITGFLTANERVLADKPVWLFSSGPTGTGDPVDLVNGQKYPTKLHPVIGRIRPRDIAVFHGSIDVSTLNFFERFMIKMVKAPTGDFRDWETITDWAKEIAAELKK